MVKRSPLGSAPSRTIGARPVRSIGFQLAPPSVDRSILPGVLQSPTVARHAVLEDVAKSSRLAGTGSLGRGGGVEFFEEAGTGDVVTVGERASPVSGSEGPAVTTRSGRSRRKSSTMFSTVRTAR